MESEPAIGDQDVMGMGAPFARQEQMPARALRCRGIGIPFWPEPLALWQRALLLLQPAN